MTKRQATIAFIAAFVAGLLLMWAWDQHATQSHTANSATEGHWSDESATVPVSSNDPYWGLRGAPVTLVIFSDFQCPYCAQAELNIDQAKQRTGPEKLRVVWKSFPLPMHSDARPAAIAAETVRAMAGNDAFWKFNSAVFHNQSSLTRENFESWAKDAGVRDAAEFRKALDETRYAAKIDKDIALGNQLAIEGTPSIFINGAPLQGAPGVDELVKAISDQQRKADALLAGGTKPSEIYTSLCKKNQQAAAQEKAQPEEGNDDEHGKGGDNAQGTPDDKAAPVDPSVWKVPVGNSPVKGDKNALVTLVVFSDFQCPFCKKVEPTLAELEKDYGKKLRFVWKDRPLPFHEHAEPAAEFAREARAQKGDAGFWAAHDLLFENNTELDDASLQRYATELKLDAARIKNAISTKKYSKDIEADDALGEQVKASGTPHMFINGRRLVGAQPLSAFKALIDQELGKAEQLVAKGTAPGSVYDQIMKNAKTEDSKDAPAPDSTTPVKGAAGAKVVITIFSDFQCPFCKRVEESYKQIEEKYGKKVQIAWRNKPLEFHKDAMLAAQAAQEAFAQKGSTGFWKFHDKLFDNQETPGGLSRPALEKYAQDLGLDLAKFKTALDSGKHKAKIEADAKIGDDIGLEGTPATVIGGHVVSGAAPFSEFEKEIEGALRRAK